IPIIYDNHPSPFSTLFNFIFYFSFFWGGEMSLKRNILHKDPMTVMVLKATDLFEYESEEEGKSKMFHATVATETQFFHVKVFSTNLKEKFTKNKVITISDYFECKGILEVNEASFVSEVGLDQKIQVPNSVIKRANETPKIDHLHKQAPGTLVYGLFMLQKKKVNKKNTIYEIQDNTGKIDVIGNGKWHNIKCNEGDKLRLFCFQLRTIDKKLTLVCGSHSFIKVGTRQSINFLQTPQTPPTAPPSSLQTPQTPPTEPPSSLQTPQTPPTAPPSSLQTPQTPPTEPPSSLQTPQTPPTAPPSSLQTPQTPPTEPPSSLQTPQTPPTNRRLTTIPKEASKECGYQKGPKEVMVLKATESFTYEFKECEKRMFHATVATESQFFRVKVFDISLKDKFIPRKVIAISDYIGRNGFLEIYSASSVSDVSANRKMEISYRLVQIANGTPKIEYLCSQCTVKYVNGVYTVYKKNVREDCTYYEIQDNTGRMEVVVYGRLTYINCEEGDKLKLFCFELAFNADKWQLRSVFHSYIKVIKTRKNKREPLNPNSYIDTSQESS
uniref:HIN-200 domain-containing protein n=1 Tax=Sciurus vulgaris TaxID=55149 RepID=A0A8D2AXD1_SCIVU